MHSSFKSALSITALAVAMTSGTAALAQEDGASAPDEILVTARKRSESITDIPISITAVTAEDLEKQSIRSIRDLTNNTPGLSMSMGGTPSSSNIVIRGLASSNFNTSLNVENNVGVFIDGIYQTSRNTVDILEVMDIGQLTIAKGPQSALYGRSTFAGAVGINTKSPPRDASYSLTGTLGTDKDRRLSGTIGGPIVDGILSGSLKATYVTFDGTVKNDAGGQKLGGYTREGLSGSLLFTPSDDLTFKVTGLTATSRTELGGSFLLGYDQHNCGGTNAPTGAYMLYCGEVKPRSTADVSNDIPATETTARQIALESTYEHDNFSIVSVTGLTRANYFSYFDYDGTSAGDEYGVCTKVGSSCEVSGGLASYDRTIWAQSVGGNQTNVKTFSQELRVQSPDENRLQWLIGGLYFSSKIKERVYASVDASQISDNEQLVMVLPNNDYGYGPLAAFANMQLSEDAVNLLQLSNLTYMGTETWSAFGGLNYKITDSLRVSAEGRYNIDRKFNNNLRSFYAAGTGMQKGTFKSFTPRFTIEFEPAQDLLTYVNAAKGVRSGGFNGVGGVLPSETSYEEESNWTYEIGVKGKLFDRRLTFALAAYKVDWSDIQVPTYSQNLNVIQTVIQNMGDMEAKGIDFEADYRFSDFFSFGGSLSYSDPKYGENSYDPSHVTQCAGTTTCSYIEVPGRGLQPSIVGNTAPRAVTWQWNLHTDIGGELSDDWSWSSRIDVNHIGKQYLNQMNLSHYGERTLVNARLAIQGPVFGLSAWVTNLFNKEYVSTALTQPRNGYPTTLRTIETYLGEGRRAGITANVNF